MHNNSIQFITRELYESLTSTGARITNLDALMCKDSTLTPLTKHSIDTVNEMCREVILDQDIRQVKDILPITTEEKEYIKEHSKGYLLECGCDDHPQLYSHSTPDNKYYDILLVNVNNDPIMLVVVNRHFLHTVTESKEELLQFHLDMLRIQYNNNLVGTRVISEYLGLKLNETYYDLVLNRLQRF